MRSTWIAMLAAALALGACGEKGPDVKAAFEAEAPKTWQVKSFKLTVTEDIGSKVEPKLQSRYEAQLAPRADLFRTIAAFDGKEIVELVAKKGKTVTAHGVVTSHFTGGEWKSWFQEETAPHQVLAAERELGEAALLFGSREYESFLSGLKSEFAGMDAAEQSDNDQIAAIGVARQAAQQRAVERQQQLNEAYRAAQDSSNAKMRDAHNAYQEKRQSIFQRLNTEKNERHAALRATFDAAVRASRGASDRNAQEAAARARYHEDNGALETEYSERIAQETTAADAEAAAAINAARSEFEAAEQARNASYNANPEEAKLQADLQRIYEARNRRYQRAAQIQQIVAMLEAYRPGAE